MSFNKNVLGWIASTFIITGITILFVIVTKPSTIGEFHIEWKACLAIFLVSAAITGLAAAFAECKEMQTMNKEEYIFDNIE
jgi:maltodextrin utilization protein YvdJ